MTMMRSLYTCTILPEFLLLVYEVLHKVMQDFFHQQYSLGLRFGVAPGWVLPR